MASEPVSRPIVSRKRQWFALWGASAGWIALYIADIVITWQACLHHEQLGGASSHDGLLILNMIVFFILFATAITAGILSYRAWRRRAGADAGRFINAEAEDRHEYMAMIGVLMTVTMGIGILWLGLPLWLIDLCVRTR